MTSLRVEEDNKRDIALIKRIAEYQIMVAGFSKEFAEDQKGTLKKYGIDEPSVTNNELYQEWVDRKIKWREETKLKCTPDNKRMAKWRERQVGRCRLSFPDQAMGNVHLPVNYEMTVGCSVGCEFCGLGAGGLKSVFNYNEENAKLFSEILKISKKVIGEAACQAGLYYSTEPLDNRDYEKFEALFEKENIKTPQITTAVPLRDVDRVKKLLKHLEENVTILHRFSIKSLDEFYGVMKAYTPEELLYVELIPQFREAPGNNFVKTGRNMDEEGISSSICCVSGFLVNMCKKTVKLLTPVIADKNFPEGQKVLFEGTFETAEEYEALLNTAIEKEMKNILDPDEKLRLYPWISLREIEGKTGLISDSGVGLISTDDITTSIYKELEKCLNVGKYTRKEIGEMVASNIDGITSMPIFTLINKMWNQGFILDQSIYKDE